MKIWTSKREGLDCTSAKIDFVNKGLEPLLEEIGYKLEFEYEIHNAIKAGDFYIYYYNYLSSEVVDKLQQKGFKVEKNGILVGRFNYEH